MSAQRIIMNKKCEPQTVVFGYKVCSELSEGLCLQRIEVGV